MGTTLLCPPPFFFFFFFFFSCMSKSRAALRCFLPRRRQEQHSYSIQEGLLHLLRYQRQFSSFASSSSSSSSAFSSSSLRERSRTMTMMMMHFSSTTPQRRCFDEFVRARTIPKEWWKG